MSRTEKILIGSLLILVGMMLSLMFLRIGIAVRSERDYIKGMADGRLYYEATGEYPTFDWVRKYQDDAFDTSEDILETLKEFDRR